MRFSKQTVWMIALLSWPILNASADGGTPVSKLSKLVQTLENAATSMTADAIKPQLQQICDLLLRRGGSNGVQDIGMKKCKIKPGLSESAAFAQLKARLQDVNNWNSDMVGLPKMSPAPLAYNLYGADGKPKTGPAQPGDFVRIKIAPLPKDPSAFGGAVGSLMAVGVLGAISGGNVYRDTISSTEYGKIQADSQQRYDWVQIQSAQDYTDKDGSKVFHIHCVPSYDPTAQPVQKDHIAHFFAGNTTNNFYVKVGHGQVEAGSHGYGEIVNLGPGVDNEHAMMNVLIAQLAWGATVDPKTGMAGSLGQQKATWASFSNRALTGFTDPNSQCVSQ